MIESNKAFAFLTIALVCLPTSAQTPSFEVVSIKPNRSGTRGSSESGSPGRITSRNTTFAALIETAFKVRQFQISGAPAWVTSDLYDFEIKTGTLKALSEEEVRPYLISLLADRIQLRTHRETREGQVYSLMIGRNGPKLTSHSGEAYPTTNMSSGPARVSVSCTNVTMESFARMLAGQLGRSVIDKTALTGGYDFKFAWANDPAPETTQPSLPAALAEQLGLRIESGRGPVEFLVIDRVEPPSEN